jgi:dTDP-4-dehydrorhamnose 3,5-epimerase
MMIEGVVVIPKKKLVDDRGAILHMLRRDDPEFRQFGEIYFSQVKPGVVKGWHLHSRMTLNYLVVVGAIQLGLWDGRETSPTYGKAQTILLDLHSPQLVVVPPGVWNGFKGQGEHISIVANCATEPHDPEEITRKPFDDPGFGYEW